MRILKTEVQGLADPQAQIAALQEQIDNLQRTVAASSRSPGED